MGVALQDYHHSRGEPGSPVLQGPRRGHMTRCMVDKVYGGQGIWWTKYTTLIASGKQNGITNQEESQAIGTARSGAPGLENDRWQDFSTWYMQLQPRPHKSYRQGLPRVYGHHNWVKHIFIGLVLRKKETWGDGKVGGCNFLLAREG